MADTGRIDHVKAKLVELLDRFVDVDWYSSEEIADHLIAHGVTVQASNPIGIDRVRRWIAVTERLPELVPCAAGTAYSEVVNVLTTGRKVITAIWDGTDFIGDAEFWDAENEEITYWTPVLLPLPASPDGT